MKKQYRLLKNRDFQKIINNKKQFVTHSLIAYFKPNNYGHIRLGLSVSKKFGNAVKRNLTRRQIRSILKDLNILGIKCDIVLIVRRSFLESEHSEKIIAIKKIFERLVNG